MAAVYLDVTNNDLDLDHYDTWRHLKLTDFHNPLKYSKSHVQLSLHECRHAEES
jgi:hypothetical protein